MTRLLERYKLAGPYEQGNNGRSFIATDLGHNRLVVLKAISCPDSTTANRAFAEWPQISKLRHPRLVTPLDAYVEGSTLYLIYEYLDGNSLSRLLKAENQEQQPIAPKSLSSQMAEELATGILDGLVYLHANEINHGSLSSENVWLDETVKLADSGLAAILAISKGQNVLPFDPQADLQKLGQLLYRCLSGIQTGSLVSLDFSYPLPNASPALRELINGLSATNPDNNFSSAAEALASFTPSKIEVTNLAVPSSAVLGSDSKEAQIDLQELVRQRETKLAHARVQLVLVTDLRQKAMWRWEIAGILLDKSEFAEALQQCQQGLTELDPEDLIGQLRFLSKRLEILYWQGDNDKAQQLIDLDTLSVRASETDPAIILADAQYQLARAKIYQALGKHDLAKKLVSESLVTFEAFDDKKALADATLVLAFAVNWVEDKPTEAMTLLESSKILCQQSNYLDGYLRCINQMGGCYWNLSDFAKVRLYFEQIVKAATIVEARHHLARALLNRAILESSEQNLDSSLDFTQKSLDIATRIGMHSAISHAYAVLTGNLTELGRVKEAIDYGRKALRYNLEYPNSKHYLDIMSSYIQVLYYAGNLVESERLALQELENPNIPHTNYLVIRLSLAAIRFWQNRPQDALAIIAEDFDKLITQSSYFPQLVEAKLLQLQALLALDAVTELDTTIAELEQLREKAQTEASTFVTSLWTMLGLLQTKQCNWEEAQNAFKQALELAERRKEAINLATAYFYYGESLLERIKGGDARSGLRSRAVGMVAHAADLYKEAGALLLLNRANNLLESLGVVRK